METDNQVVMTNQLTYKFDVVGFNLKFRLIQVETEVPKKLSNWFDHCPVLAIHSLPTIPGDATHKKVVRYLVLMLKQMPVPVTNSDIRQRVMTLQQTLEQKVTADTIVLMMMKATTQCCLDSAGVMRNPKASDKLLLVRSKTSKNGYLLALEVRLKGNVLTLVTNTFLAKKVDKGYVILQDCLKWSGEKESQVFDQNNLNGQKNLTRFFSLKDLDAFNQTKLGVMQELIDRLAQYEDCFEQVPAFGFSELKYFSDSVKITSGPRLIKQLTGKKINLVVNPAQTQAVELGSYLQKRLIKSLKASTADITVSISPKPMLGLNIQILLDHQDQDYLCSGSRTVIQHITFEKFGKVITDTGEYQWCLDDGDILDDRKIQMTMYQLLIKQDIINGKLQVPGKDELEASLPYRYFNFENLAKKRSDPVKIGVTELSFNKLGQLVFNTQIFNDDKTTETDELLEITRRVWEANGRRYNGLIGAIMNQNELFLILKSELITMPNLAQIKQFMELSNGDNIVSRSELLESAQTLPSNTSKESDIKNKLINAISAISKETLSIKQLQPYLRAVNWRTQVMKKFNDYFYQMHHKWLHSPARQKKYWMGTYGIGLITLNGENYYFVGRNLSIEMEQARAIPLKKIVAVDSDRPNEELQRIFHSFKQMMQADFVRLNQYTVIPFPFKYLREYEDMEKHKNKIRD